MKYKLLLFFFTCLGFSWYPCLGQHNGMVEITLAERTRECEVLIEGKVIDSRSYETLRRDFIYTVHRILVGKVFKGNLIPDTLHISTYGGQLGNRLIKVDHSLELYPGQVGLFFLHTLPVTLLGAEGQPLRQPVYTAYSDQQGMIRYDEITGMAADPFHLYQRIDRDLYRTIESMIGHSYQNRRSVWEPGDGGRGRMEAVVISSFAPSTLIAGAQQKLTITGSGFGATRGTGNVFFANADNGGSTTIGAPSQHIVSWSDTRIEVLVPEEAGTGRFTVRNSSSESAQSTGALTVSYALSEILDSRDNQPKNVPLGNTNSSGGYTLQFETSFKANTAAVDAFHRALTSWRCSKGVNYSTANTPTTVNVVAEDGVNIVRFDTGTELPAGTLGRATSYYTGCGLTTGPINWRLKEIDIVFDSGSDWNYAPVTIFTGHDFESVALHELGHTVQLAHVINPGAVMHYAIARGTQNRVLSTTDLAAAETILAMSGSTASCGPGAHTRIPSSNCSLSSTTPPVAAFSAGVRTICAGASVNFTDQSTGATSRNWTFTGGTPSNSTAINPVVTYSAPGIYSVSLTVTNAGGSTTKTENNYITVHALPVVNLGNDITLCSGSSATLNAGNPGATYLWSTGATSQQITVSTSGTYTVEVTQNGCRSTGSVRVNVNSATTANAGADVSICQGGSTTLNASGGSMYVWSPSTGLSNPNIANPVASPSVTTTYTVVVSSPGGCTAASDQVVVSVVPAPVVDLGSDVVTCAGKTVTLNAGNAGAQYRWSTGATTQNLTVTSSGTYTVEVTSNGCKSSDAVNITFNPLPKAAWNFSTDPADPKNINFQNTSTDATSFVWDFGDGTVSNLPNPVHAYSRVGTFQVTLTASNACGNSVFSNTVTSVVSGLADELAQTIDLFPNPSTGSFKLVFNQLRPEGKLIITNAVGQVVYEQEVSAQQNRYDIALPKKSGGVYILQMEIKGHRVTKRVVMQ